MHAVRRSACAATYILMVYVRDVFFLRFIWYGDCEFAAAACCFCTKRARRAVDAFRWRVCRVYCARSEHRRADDVHIYIYTYIASAIARLLVCMLTQVDEAAFERTDIYTFPSCCLYYLPISLLYTYQYTRRAVRCWLAERTWRSPSTYSYNKCALGCVCVCARERAHTHIMREPNNTHQGGYI